ncbi:hypothetical protein VPH35_017055 [Triticum aestivum]
MQIMVYIDDIWKTEHVLGSWFVDDRYGFLLRCFSRGGVPDLEFDGVSGVLPRSDSFNGKGFTFGEPPWRSAKLLISDGAVSSSDGEGLSLPAAGALPESLSVPPPPPLIQGPLARSQRAFPLRRRHPSPQGPPATSLQEEVKRIQSVPLVIGQFLEMVDGSNGIVGSTTGSNYYVRILSTIDRELLKPSASVALHRHFNALVDVLPPEADSSVSLLAARLLREAPTSSTRCSLQFFPEPILELLNLRALGMFGFIAQLALPREKELAQDIGGCGIQKQEIREAVELPLTHHELYKQIGIDPPRGVLLYGPPGTGKTMLAKAVAHHTTAAFIRVVGSEFVQKYLGEGPRMVRDVFRLAKENGPAIIFIDEVDAIATARFDAQTGADREVQRILMELLNQMDGFDQTVNVKVIMATNRADTLDPALLRPGRLDRKIEFPLPDRRQKRLVFQMAAICQEAGMHAVRKNRYVILPKDFEKGYRTNVKKPETDFDLYK